MNQESSHNTVFSKNVIEFVTVAIQYCSFLENIDTNTEKEATDKLTKLLPLLYIKATLLPEFELDEEIYSQVTVTENDYNYILSKVYNIYTKNDSYLEVFLEDMKYSDTPISESISENLTDIYQDVKNFISIFEMGIEKTMSESLYICTENFKLYWGQSLVNVLRALHSLKYTFVQYIDSIPENTEEEW